MRWIYGKQDFSTIERGQENCYLLTNGLGGFSSLTMTGSAARRMERAAIITSFTKVCWMLLFRAEGKAKW